MREELVRQSKFLSLVLRHKPEEIGLELDKQGWANVQELLSKMKISKADLDTIVSTDNKGRYSFNEDETKIRANQGHSCNVDIEMKKEKPPVVLYHGTAERFIQSIKSTGITSQSRLMVHLSKDAETAMSVGKRHGNPVILEIDSEAMYNDGIDFFISENGVWQVKEVPTNYIKF